MDTETFWGAFLAAAQLPADTPCFETFHYCDNEYWANELLRRTLTGQKRATSSSLPSYEAAGEPLPKPGDLSVITDWMGNPRCVIETTAVTLLPFREMTFEICRREGEDECLSTWQATHRKVFIEEAAALGYTFSEDALVVFEDFRVLYPMEPMEGKDVP